MKRFMTMPTPSTILQLVVYAGLVWFAFTAFFDVSILNPTNIGWISEGDLRQHYLGWVAFRQAETLGAPWASSPLLAYPFGAPIAATDSNPLVSLLLWPIEAYLPQDFQFIGVWYFVSLCLSLFVASALMQKAGFARLTSLLLGAVLAFQPILFWRYGHDTLMAQWLILAAIYVSFAVTSTWRAMLGHAGLLALAMMIHPYLFVLLNFVVGFDLLFRAIRQNGVRFGLVERAVLAFVAAQIAALYFGVKLGVFALSTHADNPFGVHTTDLLSIINPFNASGILPQLRAGDGQYEGFAYLGLGLICLAIGLIVQAIRGRLNIAGMARLGPLYVAAAFAFVFALGPTVTLLGDPIWSLNLGDDHPVRTIFEKLRSSGRFVWLTVYVLVLSMLLCLPRNKPAMVNMIAVAILVVQFIDLAPLRDRVHTDTAWREVPTHVLASDDWAARIDDAEYLFLSRQLGLEFSLHAGAVAFPRNTPVSWFYTAQGLGLSKQHAAEEQLRMRVLNGGHTPDALYLLDPTFDLPLVHRNNTDILATQSYGEFDVIENETFTTAPILSKTSYGLTELLELCSTDCTAVITAKGPAFAKLSSQAKTYLGARGSRIADAVDGDGYVAILRNGALVDERLETATDTTLNATIANRVFSVLSSVEDGGVAASISLDGSDFSRDRAGLNIVLVTDAGRIVSAHFDTAVETDSLYPDETFQDDLAQLAYADPATQDDLVLNAMQPVSGDQPFIGIDRYLSAESSLLDVLSGCRQDCTMAISVKDEGAASLPKRVRESAAQIGLTMADLDYRDGYAAIIENGIVLVQGRSADELVDVAEIVEDRRLRVQSAGYDAGAVSSITLDGEEHSMSRRGFNIVVLIDGARTISYHFDTHGSS